MPQAKILNIAPTKRQRKTYYPFKFMLRSSEYEGKGAALAENCYIDDARLKKLKGQEAWKDTVDPTQIAWMGEYKKSDGTYQTLYAYLSGSIYLLKAVDDDGTILTPTGGAGDVNFTSILFDIEQIGDTGYIINDSATTPMYSWDGAALTAITNAPTNPKYLLRDGNRLATNKVFSGEELPDFTEGAGVQADGDYAMSLEPTGGVKAGAGIIVFGRSGAEAHKVIPNSASDDVSAKTKIETFSYTGEGIENTHQCVAGKNFVYFFNANGIQEMNPYTGETKNLTDVGNIARRWATYNLSSAFIDYDSKNERIVVVVKTAGQNDTMIVVDIKWKERPISISTGTYFTSSANVNGQLYGGSSQDGKILKVFESYSNRDAEKLQFRYIIEWDALTNAMLEKRLKRFSIFANLNPQSSFTARLYKNGSQEPIKETTFTASSSLETGSLGTTISPWNKYVFNLGGGRDVASASTTTDKIKRVNKTAKVSTYALEIIENSFYEFSIYDILVEYKASGRLAVDSVLPNSLF